MMKFPMVLFGDDDIKCYVSIKALGVQMKFALEVKMMHHIGSNLVCKPLINNPVGLHCVTYFLRNFSIEFPRKVYVQCWSWNDFKKPVTTKTCHENNICDDLKIKIWQPYSRENNKFTNLELAKWSQVGFHVLKILRQKFDIVKL